MIYLDCNATTPPSDAVRLAIANAMNTTWGNPSSVHVIGQRARAAIDDARGRVAALLCSEESEVVFTSCASESIRTAIGSFASMGVDRIVTSGIDHPVVKASCAAAGIENVEAPVDREGVIDAGEFSALLDEKHSRTAATLTLVCGQTGAVQPVEEIANACDARGIPLHIDATQAIGKMPVHVAALNAGFVSASVHKFRGPKGVGFLCARRGARVTPLIAGSQERERRGGTESVAMIVGAGAAAEEASYWLADPALRDRLLARRERFEGSLLAGIEGATLVGPPDSRLWTTTCVTLADRAAELAVIALSEKDVMIGAGTACSSGSIEPPAALDAIGLSEDEAECTIRVSSGTATTDEELDAGLGIMLQTLGS